MCTTRKECIFHQFCIHLSSWLSVLIKEGVGGVWITGDLITFIRDREGLWCQSAEQCSLGSKKEFLAPQNAGSINDMSSAHGKSIFNCDGILVGWANTILTNTTDSVKTERNDKGNVDCMLFYWHTLIFICLKVEIHLTINTCKWLFRKINDYYFVTIRQYMSDVWDLENVSYAGFVRLLTGNRWLA